MLAAHLGDPRDTLGQWMAHQLAELVTAAQDDANTTLEQRQQIIELILKIWTHRRSYPGRAPLDEFTSVFLTLDRLGDSRPWMFSRPFDDETTVPGAADLPLVTTALELERLTRETLLHLLWLTAQDAKEKNHQWLEIADKVASNLESDLTSTLSQLHRRLQVEANDPREVSDTPGCADSVDACTPARDESDPRSNNDRVKRLREMADQLTKIADALAAPGQPD